MNRQELVEEAYQLHMSNLKNFYKIVECFLSRGENRILLWLEEKQDVCAIDIIGAFGLSAGRTSNILKSLENKGYLIRVKDDKDQRKAYIQLTPKGNMQAQRIRDNLRDIFEEFFSVIGDEDAAKFLEFENTIMSKIDSGEIKLIPKPRV